MKKYKVILLAGYSVCFMSESHASNPEIVPGPWIPDSKAHKATYKIGTLPGGADLEAFIEYIVSWEVRLCGEHLEYQKLKWVLNNKPALQAIPLNSNVIFGDSSFRVTQTGFKWSIKDVGSTFSAADKMQIGTVLLNHLNVPNPIPAGAQNTGEGIPWTNTTGGPDPSGKVSPQVDGLGRTLTYTDVGHGLLVVLVSPTGVEVPFNGGGYAQASGIAPISNPPKP